MAALVEAFHQTLEAHSFLELFLFMIPLCAAFASGVVIGWVWRPKQVILEDKKSSFSCSSSPRSPHSKSTRSPLKGFGSAPCLSSLNLQSTKSESLKDGKVKRSRGRCPSIYEDCRNAEFDENPTTRLSEDDLAELCQLVEMKDGGPPWIQILDRYTSSMSYQAWRRDPKSGPLQYRTRTVFENATPEMVRDFFWDDDFRSKWDEMLVYSTIIEECRSTGNMVVRWIRKFPFFCNDREYVIGRRIWESGRSYYCVTKAVSSSIPRREKPKRVDLYYSSWYIRAEWCRAISSNNGVRFTGTDVASISGDDLGKVTRRERAWELEFDIESRREEGKVNDCEVLLFHQEDIGIPYEVAKLAVKQGMWGVVKKIEPGLRAYQKMRSSNEPLSRTASMAHINTKISPEFFKSMQITPESPRQGTGTSRGKSAGQKIPRALLIGGFVALAMSLNRGFLSKALFLGIVRQFSNIGKR